MKTNPAWPKGPFTVGKIGEVLRILDRHGNDVMTLPGGADRLVACANAIPHTIAFPESHVATTEERCTKLEQLRRDAWATAEKYKAQLDAQQKDQAA